LCLTWFNAELVMFLLIAGIAALFGIETFISTKERRYSHL
jgi:hypothetical protein